MGIFHRLGEYADILLELIYPQDKICIVCNAYIRDRGKYNICSHCIKGISFIGENSCDKCSKVLSTQDMAVFCRDCSKDKYFFDKAIALVEYDKIVAKLIYKFKYYDCPYLAREMAQMMADKIKRQELNIDGIIGVPLHHRREKRRGYNQSHLLAKYVGKILQIRDMKNVLIRKKYTEALHKMSRSKRRSTLEGAFQVRDREAIKDKDILLIDDIFTTGATANSCSKVLLEAGAKSVTVITFARGILKERDQGSPELNKGG